MRKAKIVCTIGPASENEEILRDLIQNGMNAARLNFSHGDFIEHGKRIEQIKKLRKEMNKSIAIILDTKGPEIRTGNFKEGKADLVEGQKFIVTTKPLEGDNTICSVTYEKLHEDVKAGDCILIDDGLLGLRVEKIVGQDIHCVVLNNAPISNHKGVNVPNVKINLPALTQKDIDDIKFGIDNGIDIIAASFIRKPEDVIALRKVLESNGGNNILIISKIENREGVDNLDEIIKLSDGIMVARGDLGVEIPVEEVPVVQKLIIEKCNKAGKPVITATQMLDSMIRNPRPTRAEASDVANAILDGTDAIMLSGETANGKYPVEAVATMAKIAEKAETTINYEAIQRKKGTYHMQTVPDAVSYAAVSTATELNASAIITVSQTGRAARRVSKYRPMCQVIAVTPDEQVARRLSIVWGVFPIISGEMETVDEVIDKSVTQAYEQGYVKKGELVVLVTGVPVGYAGTTNLMKVHIVGELLVRGVGIGQTTYGNANIITSLTDADAIDDNVSDGDIIVVKKLDSVYKQVLGRISGIIVEEGGFTNDIALECINRKIPIITGAEDAAGIIKSGALITMDTKNGVIYSGKANVL